MRRPAALFTIVLALGAIMLATVADAREEGPTEIEKCQTISKPGSYKLVGNLTATDNLDCLLITANFVTIDLAGFSISSGSAAANGIGVAPTGPFQGIAVRNGSISGFQIGVNLGFDGNGSGSIVEGLRLVGIGAGLEGSVIGIVANGIVKGNTVSGYLDGISASGVVTGNVAVSNGRTGIAVGAGSTVIGNTASGTRVGLAVDCPSNVTDNTAIGFPPNSLVLNGDGCNNTNNVAP